MSEFQFGGDVVWRPSDEIVAQSRLKQFMDRHGIASLEELQRRSTDDIEWFWTAVLNELGIEFYSPYERILDTSRGIAWPRWCCGGKMNIVHNCLDKWKGTPVARREAIRWEGENGETRTLTYEELNHEVCRLANALQALGMEKGDVAALFMPMMPETVAALFAVIKLGGIILPLFSGYGAAAVAERLRDSEAKFLFTVDGFYRRGQKVLLKPVADEAVSSSSVQHVLVLKRLGMSIPWTPNRDRWWHEEVEQQSDEAETERTDAEDPLMIIYTSGTTGPAQRSPSHPLWFSDQSCPGHAAWLRCSTRRRSLLGDGHGMDDGAVGGFRHNPARRDNGSLRGSFGFSRTGSFVVACRAASGEHSRRLADLDSESHAPWNRPGGAA